jgi:CheY-like chemotaxis protein
VGLLSRMAATQSPRTIVIADDEPLVRNLLTAFLQRRNLRVLYASNGREALDLIRQETPPLVLLDIDMPELDGITVCAQIRADPHLRGTRVIMVTGRDDLTSIQQGRAAEADGYLTKPFQSSALLELVDLLLAS